MNRLYKVLSFLSLFVFGFMMLSQGQQYKNSTATSGSNNAFPMSSTTSNKVQWLIKAGEFTGAYSGYITAVYIMAGTTTSSSTFTNVTVKLGHNSTTGLSAGAWITANMQTCYTAATTVISSTAGTFYKITLQTPFLYDPTQNLILDLSQTAYTTGITTVQFTPGTGNRRAWGPVSGTASTGSDGACAICGIDMMPASGFDLGINSITSPKVLNIGNNTVTVTVMNKRVDTIKWFDIAYQLNNNTPVTVTNHYPSTPILSGKTYDYTFSTPLNISTAGTYQLKVWVANTNDSVPDNDKSNDTLKTTICTGISGTFSVGGTGADYPDLQTAINALAMCGVAGPVNLNVNAGTYTGRTVIPQILGTSATNKITIKGTGASSCKLTYSGTSTAYSTVFLNGADFVSFDGFTIENTATTYAAALTLSNEANNNKFSNNIFIVPQVSTSVVICVRGSASDAGTAGGNIGYNNYFYNNNMIGGYYGIYWYGTGSSTGPKTNFNNTFEKNTIESFYYYGAMFYYTGGTKFKFNKIHKPGYQYAYGLSMYYPAGDTIVSNIIEPGTYGIYYYYNANRYNTGFKSLIANNFIYNFANASLYTCGIYNYYYNYYVSIVNNTIVMNGGSSYNSYTYAAIYSYYPYYNDISNNIIVNNGYNFMLSFYYPYSCTSDYNLLYYSPTAYGGNPSGYSQYYYYPESTGNIANFQAFVNLSTNTTYLGAHNKNSLPQYDPKIVSNTDLHHITGFRGYLGKFIPGLLFDVDGDLRCVFQTYMGADGPFHPSPNIGFISSDTVCKNSPVTFFNTSDKNEPHLVKWFIGYDEKSTDFHFTHTFANTGTANVKLAFQSCVKTDTFAKTVNIIVPYKAPLAEFMVSKNLVEIGETLRLFDFSDRCPDSWEWEISPSQVIDPNTGIPSDAYTFINNTNLTTPNPELFFNYPGPYTVSLTVSNTIGKSQKTIKVDYINVKFKDNMCGTFNETSQKFGTLLDNGGENNYTSKTKCNYTIKSCGKDIDIRFLQFNLADKSYLRLYDGHNAEGSPMWDITNYPKGITGGMNNPKFDTFLRASYSGMVYMEFESDVLVAAGFKLEWSSSGASSIMAPVAAFNSGDTGCVTLQMNLENISIGDPAYTIYKWDYDGNGTIDDKRFHGKFGPITFPGLSALYKAKLIAENCGGIDTAENVIVLINPQYNPVAEPMATVLKPVVNSDFTTLYVKENKLSCVDKVEWIITPSDFYFVNNTDKFSLNPQIIFTKKDSFSVTVVMGNSNSTYTSTSTKLKYIVPIEYCAPAVASQHIDIGISHVKLGSIDNFSLLGQSGYTNYSNTQSTELSVDKTYSMTIERNSNYNNVYVKVWIDYNMDGEFNNQTEIAVDINNSGLMKWEPSFHVPLLATIGSTTMRVAVGYAGTPGPCGPMKYGEFEDYRIFITPDNEPPVITVLGNNPAYIEQGYTYTDAGATALDNMQGNVTSKIVTVNNVNTKVVGNYMITYDVCDSLNNCAPTSTRLVVVTKDNTKPEITLIGGDPLYYNVNDPFVDKDYTATDLVDGDLTAKVVITHNVDAYKLGTYTATYTVTDNAGLTDTKQRNVVIKDVEAPSISLIGDAVIYHPIMTSFTDPGVNYSDNYWPNNKIIFDKKGVVDTTKIGTYVLSYSVTDFSGNGPNSVTRTVIVYDSIAPLAELIGADEVVLEVNEPWYDPGIKVTDNSVIGFVYEITGSFYNSFTAVNGKFVPNKIGLYTIFYLVKDEAGNSSDMIPRVVNVVDLRCPELTLKGDMLLSVEKWKPYVDEGYTVTDNYYPLSQIKVDTFNNVNIHMPGLYYVHYTATDPSNNNCITVTRMVKVVYNNVGIDENVIGKVSVYPNPTKGKFTVDIDLPLGSVAAVSVVNLLGEEVKSLNKGELRSNKFEVDLSEFASGIYMVKVQSAKQTLLEKVILTK